MLAVLLRIAPPAWREATAYSIRRTLLAPLLAVQHQAETQKNARARFQEVLAERDSAVLTSGSVNVLRDENRSLRALLRLEGRVEQSHVTAEVMHQSFPTDGLTLLLSAGARDGVKVFDPVIAPRGLVGVVQEVDPRTSIVMTWAHPDFRVSVMAAEGQIFGLVAPLSSRNPNTALMELRGVPYREKVEPGTVLLTSGVGGVYPRGIPVGEVLSVQEDREGWIRTYLVRAAVPPGSVSHVIILTDMEPDSLAFPDAGRER